jgi:hypothetical protein
MPLACMSREMGQRIGASMGVVEEVDVDEAGVGWGSSCVFELSWT